MIEAANVENSLPAVGVDAEVVVNELEGVEPLLPSAFDRLRDRKPSIVGVDVGIPLGVDESRVAGHHHRLRVGLEARHDALQVVAVDPVILADDADEVAPRQVEGALKRLGDAARVDVEDQRQPVILQFVVQAIEHVSRPIGAAVISNDDLVQLRQPIRCDEDLIQCASNSALDPLGAVIGRDDDGNSLHALSSLG